MIIDKLGAILSTRGQRQHPEGAILSARGQQLDPEGATGILRLGVNCSVWEQGEGCVHRNTHWGAILKDEWGSKGHPRDSMKKEIQPGFGLAQEPSL